MLDSKIKVGIINLEINNIHSISKAYQLIVCKFKLSDLNKSVCESCEKKEEQLKIY